VRTAIGARGGRLMRQFLIEGLLLSSIAAVLSIVAASAGLNALTLFSSEEVFPAIAHRWPRARFRRDARADLPGRVFIGVRAHDRPS
jgi:ABC-type antimicrobial peptide transport system permease subunit